jgi:hypothetical protein
MNDRIVVNNEGQKAVQAYINYRNIVGDDDGGKMMTDEEFEAYKKKVAEARKNHLYVYWVNSKGYECKAIGPESMCFCGHRYKSHNFDNVKTKKVTCKTSKCKCPLFNYVPVYGSNDVKCLCKHSYTEHDVMKRNCTKPKCICSGFGSKFTCNCTFTYDEHKTNIETREERVSQGKTVDPGWMSSNLTAGMGGLNSFQGMVNDVYQLEYNALMNDPNKKLELMGDFEGKQQNSQQLVKKGQSTVTAYELFTTPHKFGGGKKQLSTGDEIKSITKKVNKFSIK